LDDLILPRANKQQKRLCITLLYLATVAQPDSEKSYIFNMPQTMEIFQHNNLIYERRYSEM